MTEIASQPTARPRTAVNRWAIGGACAGAAGLATGWLLGYGLLGIVVTGAFFAALAVATVIDLQERRIPNRLTYTGTGIALAMAAVSGGGGTFLLAAIGMLAGGGAMLVVWIIGRGKLGLGDVKLAAFAGAVLGPSGVPPFLLAGTLAGGLVALALLATGRGMKSTFAYGPAMAVGAVVALVFAGPLVQ